jgi:hypothetical protein
MNPQANKTADLIRIFIHAPANSGTGQHLKRDARSRQGGDDPLNLIFPANGSFAGMDRPKGWQQNRYGNPGSSSAPGQK